MTPDTFYPRFGFRFGHRMLFLMLLSMVLLPALATAQSSVRVVHAVPDGPGIDVYLDGGGTPAVSNLGFRGASAQVAVSSGTHNVKVVPTGAPVGAAVINADLEAGSDTAYTVIAVGRLQSLVIEPLLLGRPLNTEMAAGSALLRVVHASPDAGPLGFTITDMSGTVNDLGSAPFKTVSGYLSLPAGPVHIAVSTPDKETLYDAVDTLEAGDIVTVMVMGLAANSDVKLYELNDLDGTRQAPMRELNRAVSGEAQVRVVHLVPDGPAIDIFLDNATPPAVSNLAFRDASGLELVEPGEHNFKIGASGVGIGSAVVDADIPVHPDSIYSVYAVGTLVPLTVSPLVLASQQAPTVPPGAALVRVLHAVPDIGNVDITITDASGGTVQRQDVAFKEVSPYIPLPVGKVQVDIAEAGGAVIYSATGVLSEGDVLTIAATGRTGTAGELRLNVVDDGNPAAQRPLAELTPLGEDESAVRVVHLASTFPTSDVYIDGGVPATIGDVEFREATAVTTIAAGQHNFRFGPAGFGIGSAVTNTDIDMSMDSVYTLFGIDAGMTLQLGAVALAREAALSVPSGMALIRFLNTMTSGDLPPAAVDITVTTGPPVMPITTVDDLSYPTATAYTAVGAGEIRVSTSASDSPTFPVTLPEGRIATLILGSDFETGESVLWVVYDDDQSAQSPVEEIRALKSAVPTTGGGVSGLAVSPNPTTGTVRFRIGTTQSAMARISIYDPIGRSVWSEVHSVESVGETVSLSVADLPTGVYTIVVTGSDGVVLGHDVVMVVR